MEMTFYIGDNPPNNGDNQLQPQPQPPLQPAMPPTVNPPITHVCQSFHNEYKDEEVKYTITPNHSKNIMEEETKKSCRKSQGSQTHDNLSYSPTDISGDERTETGYSRRTIAKGTVEIESVFNMKRNFTAEGESYAMANLTDINRTEKHIEIPLNVLLHKTKELKHILIDNGIGLPYSDSAAKIQEYLQEEYAKLNRTEVRYDGFYIEDNRIHHSEEDELYKNAADSCEIAGIFRLNSAQGEHPPYLNLTLMGIGCIAYVLTLLIHLGYTQLPLVILTNPNPEKAAMELSKIFCDTNKPIKLRKGYENELHR